MPLARYAMYTAGVQIYVAPTWDSSEGWPTATRHIAREGRMFVISCAPCVKADEIPDRYEFKQFYPEGLEFFNKGKSRIFGPNGSFMAGPLEAEQSTYTPTSTWAPSPIRNGLSMSPVTIVDPTFLTTESTASLSQ